ncbi:MAG: succinyl-diaminopimelate desuccinylase [Proteobacteria bacterium]|nr:MAG: succinyl-diaminopimelate desuccinylase [Pseudomonadota bacterium]
MAADPVAIARELIRCPSVTPEEGGAIAYLQRVLAGAGFDVHRVMFTEPGYDNIENLYARIGNAAPHFVFAGHTDVVPPGEEQLWSYAPFAGEVSEEVLFGRGAVDMKGAIACALAATFDYLSAHHGRPKGSIGFLITGDEEGVAVNGTVKLLKWAADRGEKFDHCLLGEPSNSNTVSDTIKLGRRGSLNGTLVVTGTSGHVAYPQLADNPVRGIVTLISALLREPLDDGTAHFDPSNLEFTSIDVGNKTVNVIPGEARARFNIRFNDRHSRDTLKSLIEQRAAAAAGPIRWRIDWEPSNADAFLTSPGPFVDLVQAAVKEVTGKSPALSTTGGTSDARFIKDYCPVLEFGLVNQTMHKIDERVPTADLVTLTKVYRTILERYFG